MNQKLSKVSTPTPDWVNPYHESRDTTQNIGGKNIPQFTKDNNGFGTCAVIKTYLSKKQNKKHIKHDK